MLQPEFFSEGRSIGLNGIFESEDNAHLLCLFVWLVIIAIAIAVVAVAISITIAVVIAISASRYFCEPFSMMLTIVFDAGKLLLLLLLLLRLLLGFTTTIAIASSSSHTAGDVMLCYVKLCYAD